MKSKKIFKVEYLSFQEESFLTGQLGDFLGRFQNSGFGYGLPLQL